MVVGLARYDVASLRPISRLENPAVSVFPRVSVPGDPYLHELSVLNQRSPALSPALQPQDIHGQVHRGHLVQPEPEDNWETILHDIQEIGISRFVLLLKKLPAMAMIFISLWTLWGRGFHADLRDVEKNMAISGLATGMTTVSTVSLTSQHHSNDKSNAKNQTKRRLLVSGVNTVFSVVVIVFAVIVLANVHDESEGTDFQGAKMTFNERTAQAGTMVGISLLIGAFSLMSVLFGVQGLSKISNQETKIKEARMRRQMPAYVNPSYHYDTY